MQKYLVDLFVASAQERARAPRWLLRFYLSLFSPPLGKTLRIEMVKNLLHFPRPRLEGKRILDVGCGIGDLSFLLAEHGAQVIGVELDTQKVDRASQIARKWNFDVDNLRFLTGDVTGLEQMGLGQFDGVCCIALLEHIKDDMGLLQQMVHLLRPGGFFLLEVPSARRHTIPEVEAADGHMRPGYRYEEVPALLEQVGLHVTRKQTMDPLGLNYYWFVISRLFGPKAQRWLFAALGPVFIPLIRISSRLVQRPGAELCFLAVKDNV